MTPWKRAAGSCTPDIFVCYRRSDSPGAAGRLCDHLSARFGADRVFRDVDDIRPGEDFDDVIARALGAAAVVIVVIGPRWVDARDAQGERRLHDPEDYVRREIEIALAGTSLLLPLLVEGAAPLSPGDLPDSIQPFARRQALRLSDGQWREDVSVLSKRLAAMLGEDASHAPFAPDAGDPPGRGSSPTAAAVAAVARYPVDLGSMLRAPRRSLSRRFDTREEHAVGAFVFFVVSVLVSDSMLLGVYQPRDSMFVFLFSGLILALFGTVALSLPLWLVWRLVGARTQYSLLLIILLYQAGVVHLLVFSAIAVGFLVVEVKSLHAVSRAMAEALEAEGSIQTAVATLAETLLSAVDGHTALMAMGVSLAGAAAAGIFLVRAWGAYADAFRARRAQSAAAAVLLIAVVLLPVLAVGLSGR